MKEEYPLFVKWQEILNYLLDKVEKFPRNVRFTVSDRMINLGFDIMEAIVEGIYTRSRTDILRRANLYMEKLRIYVRICLERRYLSVRQYEYLSENILQAGRMLGGWIKTSEKGKRPV